MEQRNILTVGGLATLLTIFGICYGIAKYIGRMEDRVIQLERQIEELKSKVSGVQGQKGETGPEGPRGLKGDTGPEGPRGPKGDTGPEGPRGPRGETGAQGPKGDTGNSGSSRSSNPSEVPQKASLSPNKKMSMYQLEFVLDSCKREGSGYACSVIIKNLDLKSRNLWLYRDHSVYKSRLSDVNGYEYIAESIEYGAGKNPKNKFMSNTLSAGMKIRAKFYFPAMPVVELDSFEFSAKAVNENHDEFQVKFDKPG